MKLAIVGGGAAGFFLAINAKELMPGLDVTIFEQQRKVLAKVAVSGGGRCNCTNTFAEISDLKQAYPRGDKLLRQLFRRFGPADACRWFESHGVPLVVQDDQCVFPKAQDSRAIIDCFLSAAKRLGIKIRLGEKVEDPVALLRQPSASTSDGSTAEAPGENLFDFVAVTIGGTPRAAGCVPSLFTFNVKDAALTSMMGLVVDNASVCIPGTKMRASGPLLVTHWGMSGPAILKLSSYAARLLAERGYHSPLLVNWIGDTSIDEARRLIAQAVSMQPQKLIDNLRLFDMPARLWIYLTTKAGVGGKRCAELGKKGLNRLADTITNDTYTIDSRCHYKEEFVTCGGISLDTIDRSTLESLQIPRLYYAGEVLDIDGITGGFNLQAAWTTAYTVAHAISCRLHDNVNQ